MWPFRKEKPTGMIPNPELDQDPRNLAYDEMMVFGGDIPDSGNVIARQPAILNQDRTSSCTTHSTVGAIHQATGKLLSPRWGYWRLKTDKKYASSSLPYGAYMQESAKVAVNEGLCSYELLPNYATYSDESYITFPVTKEMSSSAKSNAGGSYVYTTTVKNSRSIFDSVVKYMWEQKRPVKVGVRWYKEYHRAKKTGIIPAHWPDGTWSGHDMVAVAWKKIEGELYLGFLQSWGAGWGDKGMCWMSRNYSFFYSPIAIIPPKKAEDLKIKKEVAEIKERRNLHKERANAWELRRWIDEVWFKDEGTEARKTTNRVARGIAGREWYVLVKALAYFGWTMKDIHSYLAAHANGQTTAKSYTYNLADYKKKMI